MMKKMKIQNLSKKLALAALITTTSGLVIAASPGSLGTTSTGSSLITANVPNLVKITKIDDLTGTYDGTADIVLSDQVCVFRTGASGKYNIKATGDGGTGGTGNAFKLKAGALEAPYAVQWNATTLATNTVLIGQTGANQGATCGGGTNAVVQVTVAAADLDALQLGSSDVALTGTLTLTVAPE